MSRMPCPIRLPVRSFKIQIDLPNQISLERYREGELGGTDHSDTEKRPTSEEGVEVIREGCADLENDDHELAINKPMSTGIPLNPCKSVAYHAQNKRPFASEAIRR